LSPHSIIQGVKIYNEKDRKGYISVPEEGGGERSLFKLMVDRERKVGKVWIHPFYNSQTPPKRYRQ
jgi:hypothetical protein